MSKEIKRPWCAWCDWWSGYPDAPLMAQVRLRLHIVRKHWFGWVAW